MCYIQRIWFSRFYTGLKLYHFEREIPAGIRANIYIYIYPSWNLHDDTCICIQREKQLRYVDTLISVQFPSVISPPVCSQLCYFLSIQDVAASRCKRGGMLPGSSFGRVQWPSGATHRSTKIMLKSIAKDK